MCDYEGNEFGANYIDACCIEGYLWDLDSCEVPGGPLYSGGDIPCPECNHDEWLEYVKDDVIGIGYSAGRKGSPETENPFPEKARFEKDGHLFATWWQQGYNEALAE